MTLRSVAWALLAGLLFVPTAEARLDRQDTLVDGNPWVRLAPAAGPGEQMTIDTAHPLQATFRTPSGETWILEDGTPFLRRGPTVLTQVLPSKVLPGLVLVPPESPLLGALSKPIETTPPSPRDTTPSVPPVAKTPAKLPSPTKVQKDSTSISPAKDTAVFTVVVDAGHGGKDPGAIGGKVGSKALQEKEATLKVAQELAKELRKLKGVKVVMTRDKDEFLSLGERTSIANKAQGDLFVSLHCNSLPLKSSRRSKVNGFMVYLLREAQSEEDRAIERRENEAIRFETGENQRKEALGPVEWMMLEHQLNQFTKESERFAGIVVDKLSRKGPVSKERTGAGQAGFFVLVGALMPSVLIEMGYVSHPEDAKDLGSASGRKSIAKQIAASIDEFRRSRR